MGRPSLAASSAVDYAENIKLTGKLAHLTEPAKLRRPDNPNNGKP